MSTFHLFSPNPSDLDTDDEIPIEVHRSETLTPQSIQKEQIKSVSLKKESKKKKAHPTYEFMVDEAVYNMGVHKKGLSLFAVKKFIKEKYDLDMKRGAKRIKSVIKESLENGRYVKTTGRGLTGCFRLANNTRRTLNIKFKVHPPKSLRINLKNTKIKITSENKRQGKNDEDSVLLKGDLKRKLKSMDVPKSEENKRARKEGPAKMNATG